MEIRRVNNAAKLGDGTTFLVPHYTNPRNMFTWPRLKWADLCVVRVDKGQKKVWRFPFSECVIWPREFSDPLSSRDCSDHIAILSNDEAGRALDEYKTAVHRMRGRSNV